MIPKNVTAKVGWSPMWLAYLLCRMAALLAPHLALAFDVDHGVMIRKKEIYTRLKELILRIAMKNRFNVSRPKKVSLLISLFFLGLTSLQPSSLASVNKSTPSATDAFAVSDNELGALHDEIEKRSQAIEKKLIAWRQDIHQHPELGNLETRTAARVAEHLRSLGMDVKTGVAVTGVVGTLQGGKPGRVVALRADMDALPVKEQAGLPFSSKAKGSYLGTEVDLMHACGHDTHTAILMATAEVLAGMKDKLPGTVKFIFQPAEEGPANFEPDGKRSWGAKMMVQEGVMDNPKVDAIFGLHVTSVLPTGWLAWRPGAVTSAADTFSIDVKGKQTHGALPWQGVDPIVVGSQIVMGIQTIISRQSNIMKEPAVITVGTFNGGNRTNIIPEEVKMTGSIRSYNEDMRKDIHHRLQHTVGHIAESAGAKGVINIMELYDAVNNDAELTQQMSPTLQRVAGPGKFAVPDKVTASEDFSFYQQKAPGLFFNLGVTPPGTDPVTAPANHSPLFYVDEAALLTGVRAMSNLTVDYLFSAK
ncbi:N-acyl-L-amino acid amidohydrolase [Pectobacterium carotovorum subsp. carotovorum]|nr:N-acyl-L-amino acid amidohydrolase [Pectobacterium carotovorum subsp. carotovorum]